MDDGERADVLAASVPPVAEFDPTASVIPLPNSLLLDPSTGRLQIPASCGEVPGSAAAQLRATLNQLDGFGTSKASLVATLSHAPDPASLAGHVFLVRFADHGTPLTRFDGPVPIDVSVGRTTRFSADCTSTEQVPNLTIQPRAPLLGSSSYGVLLTRGIRTEDGTEFDPSPTWALVRQADPLVQFATGADGAPDLQAHIVSNSTALDPTTPEGLTALRGLDQLWRGHAPLLRLFDLLTPALTGGNSLPRENVLLAWAFQTETLGDPLDPSSPGSAAAALLATPGSLTIADPVAGSGGLVTVEQFFTAALPEVPCSSLGCDAIGAIYTASPLSTAPSFTSTSFLTGDDCKQSGALAGAFNDPVAPAKVCERQLPLLIVVPATPPPDSGYPTVIFAHGLGRSKEDLLAIAGALGRAGIASVALDAVDHGARAVQVSTEAALGCAGAGPGLPCTDSFGPTCAPQCFAPLLSANLAATRDHLRQTVLDQLKLEKVIEGCSEADACGLLRVDPARIGLLGQSLGSLIGGVTVALSGAMPVAALNVSAGDWMQILSDSNTLAIRCPLIDSLIAAGVLAGEPWNQGANPNALCVGESWKADANFQQFAATARWILDPVDNVNYASRYRGAGAPAVLLSEVLGDAVVPNSATLTFATALGLPPESADPALSPTPDPSTAVLAPGSHWVQYQELPAVAAVQFPGNAYAHGSLLAPATPGSDMGDGSGELGTVRMQVDTVSYLASHFGGAQ